MLPALGAAAQTTDFHAHHAIQITLSLGGRFELRTETVQVAGNAIVAPDKKHIFESEGRVAHLFVEPESEAGRAIAASHLGEAPLAPLPGESIADLVIQLAEAFQDSKTETAVLEGIGRALVARLAGVSAATLLDPRVRRIIDYAAAHLDGPIALPSAAKVAGLSPSRARHLFVEQTGLPFRTYLLWLRIMKAVGQFSQGVSLTEAAHQAGFADSAHFSRTFRRMFGISAASLRLT
jgi:AraC family transcriptional regulator